MVARRQPLRTFSQDHLSLIFRACCRPCCLPSRSPMTSFPARFFASDAI